jgi:hypothetical protein
MNIPIPRESELSDSDDLNEIVLHDAARIHGANFVPQDSSETADVVVWDEVPGGGAERVPVMPEEGDESIAERLVEAGNEEAGREQRQAAKRA